MTGLFEEPDGATPLSPQDANGLRQAWIATRQDLNEAEQANILAGMAWAARTRQQDLLNVEFARRLHRAMFGRVWRWAGTFRTRETNIGVQPYLIGLRLRETLDYAKYWAEQRTFGTDEIAVRLHHRVVSVHPFPNGNGRHSRLMADLVAQQFGGRPFTWGGSSLSDPGETRALYMQALRSADAHDIAPLLAFARS